MTQPRPNRHPWWCDHPQAPADSTHTHTRAIGVANLGNEVSIDAAMVQAPEETTASLTLHVATPRQPLSITTGDREMWQLAGVLVDATVMLRQAGLDEPAPPPSAPPGQPGARQRVPGNDGPPPEGTGAGTHQPFVPVSASRERRARPA